MAYRVELPRSSLGLRVSILALIAVGGAGCSADVTRFNDNPFSSASRPSADVTGSVSRAPAAPAAPAGRIESQPLPQASGLPAPPPRNASATGGASGTAAGGGGMGSDRPQQASGDITGSVQTQPAQPARVAMAAPQAGQPTVVTLAPGETLAVLSRRYGVSIAELIKANGFSSPNDMKIGQRVVIPRQGIAARPAATAPAPQAGAAAAAAYGGFHIAGPGDTMMKIAQRYRVTVADLARANKIPANTQMKLGDRLAIPAQASSQPGPAPRADAAPAKPQQQQQVATIAPPHTANLASPTENPEAEAKPETAGALFRWPVRGRIVGPFGAKPNGQQNDGINIAVPEGTPVKAAEDGEVAYAGNELKGYGNLILVRHANGFVTAYAHVSELMVKRGDKVKRGQVVAKSGRTGNVSAPQLHFEIRKGSTPVDPTPYLGA